MVFAKQQKYQVSIVCIYFRLVCPTAFYGNPHWLLQSLYFQLNRSSRRSEPSAFKVSNADFWADNYIYEYNERSALITSMPTECRLLQGTTHWQATPCKLRTITDNTIHCNIPKRQKFTRCKQRPAYAHLHRAVAFVLPSSLHHSCQLTGAYN